MASVRIDSRRGLGVNEQFMALAPTGYGKEEIPAPFEILARELQETARPTGVPSASLAALPKIQHSAPASQQGLHRISETNPPQTFLADDFAEWLDHSSNDVQPQQDHGHIQPANS